MFHICNWTLSFAWFNAWQWAVEQEADFTNSPLNSLPQSLSTQKRSWTGQ